MQLYKLEQFRCFCEIYHMNYPLYKNYVLWHSLESAQRVCRIFTFELDNITPAQLLGPLLFQRNYMDGYLLTSALHLLNQVPTSARQYRVSWLMYHHTVHAVYIVAHVLTAVSETEPGACSVSFCASSIVQQWWRSRKDNHKHCYGIFRYILFTIKTHMTCRRPTWERDDITRRYGSIDRVSL